MGGEYDMEIPSMDTRPEDAPVKRKPGRPPKAAAAPIGDTGFCDFGEVRLPLAKGELGYCARHIELQLTRAQAEKMKRLVLGLQRTGATLGPRREPIKSASDALRHVLDALPGPE